MSDDHVLKPVGMIFIEIILFLAVLGLSFVILAFGVSLISMNDVFPEGDAIIIDPYKDLLTDYLPWFLSGLAAVVAVHHLIYRRPLRFSGISTSNVLVQFAKGILWSGLLLSLGFSILYLFGWIKIEKIYFNGYLFTGFLLFFFIQSSAEEIMLRSFLLSTIAYRIGIWKGILLSSVLFTLLHADNPNIGNLSLFNIYLAGILLGMIYIRYRQIWAPIGLHTGWNFLQGSFFGFEVSGLNVYSYIDSYETGPDILTGGAFGFEGSILASVMLIILSLIIWLRTPEAFKGEFLISPVK